MYRFSLEAHRNETEASSLLTWILQFFYRDLYIVEININRSPRQISYYRFMRPTCYVTGSRPLLNYKFSNCLRLNDKVS
jgi:hypothetical protein